jgi:3-hydroxyacyl-CoA dehydrogenase/enoyl-CoA hydratase/3-hydroxybutyryl-CoA epimerase
MPLVEVGEAPATAERTAAALAHWAAALGKTPVRVKDSPGFVVNRILMPYLNEAVLLVTEGLPTEQVDRVMKRFGMPMGPLELLDSVGLDVAAHIAESMAGVLAERFPPNPGFVRMRERGWLGEKNRTGFYRYSGKRKRVNGAAAALLRERQPAGGAARLPQALRATEGRERMVLLMCNEAARCLAEGLTAGAELLDLAMVLGTGWAPHRGGPLRYAADRGYAEVVQALTGLAQRIGKRFEPCEELRRLAAGAASKEGVPASGARG